MMQNFSAQEVLEILIEIIKDGNQENVLREAQKTVVNHSGEISAD